ncbi:MAG: DUF3015 family protein [Bacteriovoracaceae bacterium]
MKKIFVATLLLSSLQAFSSDSDFGMGGCGLGSMIMGKDGNQVLAITTNGTGTQSFGITSGTSNCNPPDEDKTAKLQKFIEANHVFVETDIARGNGETISSISKILECNGDIAHKLQSNYATIYSDSNGVSEKITRVLSGQCAI